MNMRIGVIYSNMKINGKPPVKFICSVLLQLEERSSKLTSLINWKKNSTLYTNSLRFRKCVGVLTTRWVVARTGLLLCIST